MSIIQNKKLQTCIEYFQIHFSQRLSNKVYVGILVCLAIASHWIWYAPNSVLFHGDWTHWPTEAAAQAWHALGTWNSFYDLGTPRILIGFTVMQDMWSLLTWAGASFDTAVKLSLLIPVSILGFLAPYFLARRIVQDNFIAFIAALFYATTPYFLIRQGSHISISLVYALSPLILLTLISAIESMRLVHWLRFSLIYAVGVWYEVRIMYIVTFMLVLYAGFFLFRRDNKKVLKALVLSACVILGLSAFWLLPTLFGGAGSTIAEVANRGLFGSHLFDLQHALTVSSSGWTGAAPDESFTMQTVLPHLWIIPLVAFLPFLFFVKLDKKYKLHVLYFGILAIIGIFLSKQETPPSTTSYEWLYKNFPGFSLFREASKFYLITAWAYLGLISIGLKYLKSDKKVLALIASAALLFVSMNNLAPLITGSFGTLFVSRKMPQDYQAVNRYISGEASYTRTLWVPSQPQWAYFDMLHPIVGLVNLTAKPLDTLVGLPDAAIARNLNKVINSDLAEQVLEGFSIKYIGVPIRDFENEDDAIQYYGDDRQYFLDMLAAKPWLEKISGTGSIAFYKLNNPKPHFWTTSNLINLPDARTINTDFSFYKITEGNEFNFITQSEIKPSGAKSIADISSGLKPDSIRAGKITQFIPPGNNSLYINTNSARFRYRKSPVGVELEAAQNVIVQRNTQQLFQNNFTTALGQKSVDPERSYFFEVDSGIHPVSEIDGVFNLGHPKTRLRLVSIKRQENLIRNGSFESGAWQKEVLDCSPYDDNAAIDMELISTPRKGGQQALELTSMSHSACTISEQIPVNELSEYLLQTDYKSDVAREFGLNYEFDDPQKTVTKTRITITNPDWHTSRTLISAPKGAKHVRIRLIALPDDFRKLSAQTTFDEISLKPVTAEINPAIDLRPHYQRFQLLDGQKSPLELVNKEFDPKNKISNGSFESGMWQKAVSDCNAYDSRPDIGMNLSNRERVDGSNSLELKAKRHIACTSTATGALKENVNYMLSFDYKSIRGKEVGYYVQFDNPDRTVITERIPNTKKNWSTLVRTIRAPIGSTKMSLTVYTYPEKNDVQTNINYYDNFKLIEVPIDVGQFYLVEDDALQMANPANVKFNILNPAYKKIQINRASKPFYLVMSEKFNSKWQLHTNQSGLFDGQINVVPIAAKDNIVSAEHVMLNDAINAWYIDPSRICTETPAVCHENEDGTHNIEIVAEFSPQRLFYLGIIMTVMTFMASVLILLISALRSRHRSMGISS